MRNFLNPESRAMQIFYKATECMLLSVLWIITSLPIITIGASSSALYYTVVKVIRNDEGQAWSEYWNGFRTNFKQATIIWMVALLLVIGAIADIVVVYLLSIAGKGSAWLCLPFVLLLAFGVMWMQYIFAYLSRFADKTKTVLFNTFWMTIFHLWHSLFLLAVLVIGLLLFFFVPITIPFLVFFFPGVFGVICASVLESRFKIHMPKDEEHLEEAE